MHALLFLQGWAAKLGLPDPGLSRGQMKLKSVRVASHIGCAIGVSIGCLIGMFPLLLLPDTKSLEEVRVLQMSVLCCGQFDTVVLFC
jgi:Transmembrane protein 65